LTWFGAYWARTDEGLLVSSLKGMFGAASLAGNLLAIHSESVAGDYGGQRAEWPQPSWMRAPSWVTALNRLTAVAMHSATEARCASLT